MACRVTDEEYDLIARLARRLGQSRQAIIRRHGVDEAVWLARRHLSIESDLLPTVSGTT